MNKENKPSSMKTRILCLILALTMFGSVAVSLIYALLGTHFH